MSLAIEAAIKREDWKGARRLLQRALDKEPDSHWLITRLGLTYYEEYDYKRALALEQKAHKLAPRCPLVSWDLAGTLDMLGRHREAIAVYRRIVRRKINSLAFGDCGEGLRWSRQLVADCWYRIARCSHKLGRNSEAIRCYKRHLEMRSGGIGSIYPIKDARQELQELLKRK